MTGQNAMKALDQHNIYLKMIVTISFLVFEKGKSMTTNKSTVQRQFSFQIPKVRYQSAKSRRFFLFRLRWSDHLISRSFFFCVMFFCERLRGVKNVFGVCCCLKRQQSRVKERTEKQNSAMIKLRLTVDNFFRFYDNDVRRSSRRRHWKLFPYR